MEFSLASFSKKVKVSPKTTDSPTIKVLEKEIKKIQDREAQERKREKNEEHKKLKDKMRLPSE